MTKKKRGWILYIVWVIVSYMLGRAVAKKIDEEYHIFTPEKKPIPEEYLSDSDYFGKKLREEKKEALRKEEALKNANSNLVLELEKEPADAEVDESNKSGFFGEGAVDHGAFFKEALRRQRIVNDVIDEQQEEGEC